MTAACRPWWLRHLLALAVILPAAGVLGWSVYSVQFTDDWATTTNDAPGPALCGLFGLAPLAVGVIWLAGRAFWRKDAELHRTITAGCALGAFGLTISLCEAVAVSLGFKEGRVPIHALIAVTTAWAYFIAVGVGHWHLSRVFRPALRPSEPAG